MGPVTFTAEMRASFFPAMSFAVTLEGSTWARPPEMPVKPRRVVPVKVHPALADSLTNPTSNSSPRKPSPSPVGKSMWKAVDSGFGLKTSAFVPSAVLLMPR